MSMTDFEKEIFKSLISELNHFSNNNRTEIKRIRETTKIISSEMLEYIADNDLLDVFIEKSWSGVFVPTKYFSKIDIPEKFIAKLNEKDSNFLPIKSALASNFLNLALPKDWIEKYPNAFDYKSFKPDSAIFEILIDMYPDIIFDYSSLNSTVKKKFTLINIRDDFLDRYVKHINFSTARYSSSSASQFSPKVLEYLLGSISKISDPDMNRVFRSLLYAINSIKSAVSLSDFSKILNKSEKLFRENPEMFKIKSDIIREVSGDIYYSILENLDYFMEIYKLGIDLDSYDFANTAIINIKSPDFIKRIYWKIGGLFSKFAALSSYENAIAFIESVRILFDDEFITEFFINKMLEYRKSEAEKKRYGGRDYYSGDVFDSEKLFDVLRCEIDSDPVMKSRHGSFISNTLLRLKLA